MKNSSAIRALVMKGTGSALGFLLAIILSNLLIKGETANFYMLINGSLVISIIIRLGMDKSIIRLSSINKNTNSIFVTSIKRSMFSVIIIAITITLLFLFFPIFDLFKMFAMIVFSAVVSTTQLLCASAKGRGENTWAAFIESVPAPLATLLFLLLFNVESSYLSSFYFSAMFLSSIYYYFKIIKPTEIYPSNHSEKNIVSIRYTLSDAMNFLMVWASFFLLDILSGPDSSATYNLLVRMALLSNLFIVVINGLSARKIAIYLKEAKIENALDYSRRQALLSFLISIFFSVSILFGVYLYPEIFLIDSSEKMVCLVILLGGQFFNAITGPTGMIIAMANKQTYIFNSTIISFCVCFISQLLLIKSFGLVGAAVGSAIGILINNVMMSVYSARVLNGYVYPKIKVNYKN